MQLEFRYEETVDPSHDTADQQYDQDHQRDRKYRKVREHLGGISHGLHQGCRDTCGQSYHTSCGQVGTCQYDTSCNTTGNGKVRRRQADDVDNGSRRQEIGVLDVSVNNCYDQQDV